MTTENDITDVQPKGEGPRDFNAEPWQVLIGLRVEGDRIITAMAATPEVIMPTRAGDRPDKRNAAVFFAQWLERNMEGLQKMVMTEYAQYMNILRLTSASTNKPPELGLVDPEGKRLSSGTTQ